MNRDKLLQLLENTCLDMETTQEELRELDAKVGDGDLGVTVKLGFSAVRENLPQLADKDIGAILMQSGRVFNNAAASTFGTLMSTFLMRAGRVVKGKETISLEDASAMMKAGGDGIMELGGAVLGECTLLDSLIPAQQTIEQGVRDNLPLGEILSTTVDAAEKGVESTIDMIAKHGRAGWFKEKSKGIPDAGAVAITYLLKSFLKSYEQNVAPLDI